MKINEVVKCVKGLVRVLKVEDGKYLVVDCEKKTMPYWTELNEYEEAEFEIESRELTPEEKKIARQRFTMIADILPVIGDKDKRGEMIQRAADEFGVTKQTVRKYLCQYLVYQNVECLAPAAKEKRALSKDEKNMRWALNKYFYTTEKNSLPVAYKMMLKEKYCGEKRDLLEQCPSFDQFRYFYRKTKNLQNYYISKDGLKDYQRWQYQRLRKLYIVKTL